MTTPVNGLVGGAVAGLVSVAVVSLLDAGPSSWSLFPTNGPAEASPSKVLVAAFAVAYGGVGGALFVVAVQRLLGGLGVPPNTVDAFGAALGWAAVLVISVVVVLGITRGGRLERLGVRGVIAAHIVYALALGVWVRVTWVT